MKVHNELLDDAGQRWEFSYVETMFVPVLDALGNPVLDADGAPKKTSDVSELRFRKKDEGEWLTLPPWADIRDEWKINLGMFDEDDETGEITGWEIR